MSTLLVILLVLLVLAAVGGGYGTSRGYGYVGWSPLAAIVVILLLLWAVGALH